MDRYDPTPRKADPYESSTLGGYRYSRSSSSPTVPLEAVVTSSFG